MQGIGSEISATDSADAPDQGGMVIINSTSPYRWRYIQTEPHNSYSPNWSIMPWDGHQLETDLVNLLLATSEDEMAEIQFYLHDKLCDGGARQMIGSVPSMVRCGCLH
jgi:hypothetical protein